MKVLVTAARRDLDPDGPTVSVVVPAMNEARNLPWLAKHMPGGVTEIVLVDGNSVDDTVDVARSLWPDVRVVTQTRRGKGNALACGFHAATGDIIVMIDADGSMDPGEIPFYVDALVAGADYAKGSRFNPGGGSSDITRVRSLGNKALNLLTNSVHGTRYSDLCYGYNAFWRRILPVLALDPGEPGEAAAEKRWGDGFEVETLINIRVHTAGLQIAEVASFESERLFGSSNLNAVSDGLRVLRTIAIEKRDVISGARVRALGAAAARPAPTPLPTPADELVVTAGVVARELTEIKSMDEADVDELDDAEVRSHLIDLTAREVPAARGTTTRVNGRGDVAV
ncbi:glycosyltransferase family 2 protein [Motilibacter sp. K478]|nr:glycosyltransferase family 2 protein [Motilibacter aurantiacus]NHC44709.1 glycosyltransferase family 2 protein [Motilibacter aurantiacus]